jgi:hypothetical protein
MANRLRVLAPILGAAALSACVTTGGPDDPFAESGPSAALTSMQRRESACRAWVEEKLVSETPSGESRYREAVYYFGQLPRESAKTYVVLFPAAKGKATVALCDSDGGKPLATEQVGRSEWSNFRREFLRRERAVLAPHKQDLGPSEMANSAVIVMRAPKRGGKAAGVREYWMPKHVEQQVNDLFFEMVSDR